VTASAESGTGSSNAASPAPRSCFFGHRAKHGEGVLVVTTAESARAKAMRLSPVGRVWGLSIQDGDRRGGGVRLRYIYRAREGSDAASESSGDY
jgi:hypothetical protein